MSNLLSTCIFSVMNVSALNVTLQAHLFPRVITSSFTGNRVSVLSWGVLTIYTCYIGDSNHQKYPASIIDGNFPFALTFFRLTFCSNINSRLTLYCRGHIHYPPRNL